METNETIENTENTENIENTENTEGAENTETEGTEGAKAKRDKKLAKGIEGTVVIITVSGGEKGEMRFDTAELSPEIQAKLVPFGAGHKLGDSAAGRTGKDAEEAILKVWDGLKAGDWSVRAPAAPKVSLSDIKSSLANMSDEEREQAQKLLASMGITV